MANESGVVNEHEPADKEGVVTGNGSAGEEGEIDTSHKRAIPSSRTRIYRINPAGKITSEVSKYLDAEVSSSGLGLVGSSKLGSVENSDGMSVGSV